MNTPRPSTRPGRRSRTALTAALLVLAGCAGDNTTGYSTIAPFRADIRTVAVPIVENDTFTRDVEFALTDALIKAIESRTPYKVVPSARADSELGVRIRRIDLTQLSKSPLTGLGEEVVVGMTIDFRWRDLRTETTIAERRDFSGQRPFTPSAPSRERIELGRMAVVQLMSRDIVDVMRSAW